MLLATKQKLQGPEVNYLMVIIVVIVVVAVKSKYFDGSSGSVWRSHAIEIRHRHGVLHEIPNDVSTATVPNALRNVMCQVMGYHRSFSLHVQP